MDTETPRFAVWAPLAVFWLVVAVGGQTEESKIIDGTVVSIDKSPFLVALEQRDNASAPFFQVCGSVIIDSRYIISTAHCFLDIADDLKITFPKASDFRIRAGSSILEQGGALYSVAQYWVHPQFKNTQTKSGIVPDYDVGVARLSAPIVFGPSVAKASLIAEGQHLASGIKVIAAGWGVTKYDGPASKQLRRAIFSVVPQPACTREYQTRVNETVSERFLCTYAASKGDCEGDSGSAVFNRTDSVVVGLVSWGTCVIMPNVVTDLANQDIRSFIRSKSGLNV